MEEYLVKFWLKDKDTGFVSKQSEIVYAKGKCAHEKVSNIICKRYGIKHEDIIYVSYC